MRLLRFSLLLLIGLVALAACSAPCDEQVTAFAASANDITARYDALLENMRIESLLFDLRALKEEADGLDAPTCGGNELAAASMKVKESLGLYLDQSIHAFTLLTTETSDTQGETNAAYSEAEGSRQQYAVDMSRLSAALETTQ